MTATWLGQGNRRFKQLPYILQYSPKCREHYRGIEDCQITRSKYEPTMSTILILLTFKSDTGRRSVVFGDFCDMWNIVC